MKSVLSSLNSAQAINPELERILEAAIARLQAGERLEVESLTAKHPEFAAGLRELWPAVEMMVRMGDAAVEPNGHAAGNGQLAPPPEHKQLGDFRLIRQIGQGGMGTVYEAEQLSMGRRVALKVLPFAALVQDKSLQRFRNEVRAAAALDHPHIVSIYSVGEERGVHFYAMQLIRGQTLADMIWQLRKERNKDSSPPPQNKDFPPHQDKDFSPPLCGEGLGERGAPPQSNDPTSDFSQSAIPGTLRVPQSEIATSPAARLSTAPDTRRASEHYRAAARLGIQAADALQHAHDLGVLHRDIKPSNLMIDREAQLYITDFGLARIEADAGMTMTGDIVGTLRYMAPEQALAKRVVIDHRADIYSLGATLYELLTLQPAFGETDRSDLLKQIAFEEARPLRKIDRSIPAELETIVLKAMAKHPGERYQTAQQLADDLRAFLESRPIKAKPPTLLGRLKKWSRRHKPLVVSAAVSTAALVAITFLVLIFSNLRITRERNEKVAALEREVKLRHEAEVRVKYVQVSNFFREGRLDKAEELLNALRAETIDSEFKDVSLRRQFGLRHLVHERWGAAAANFDLVLSNEDGEEWNHRTGDFLLAGPVFGQLGDAPRYEKFRQLALSKFLNTTSPVIAERICRMSLLLPADEKVMASFDRLYGVLVDGQNDSIVLEQGYAATLESSNPDYITAFMTRYSAEMKNWGALALSMIDYRSGRYEKAIQWSNECLKVVDISPRIQGRTTAAHAIIAMAYHQLRQDDKAETAIALARIFNDAADLGVASRTNDYNSGSQSFEVAPLFDALYGHVLFREAEELLNGRPATFAQGFAAGQNMMGNIYTRGLIEARQNFAEAVKSYRKASDQGFAPAQLNLSHCYALGRGITKNPDEAARWRHQALDQFAWTCSVSSDAAKDVGETLKNIDEILGNAQDDAAHLATIAAILYRAGQYAQAIERLQQSIAGFSNESPGISTALYPQLLLAMTKRQLGEQEEARRILAETQAAIDAALELPATDWECRATLELLRREAEALMR